MRYDNWDVMLFPIGCHVLPGPMQEFKVNCQVVHDIEFSHQHGMLGLPILTCFVPSISPGTPFKVSIHSWTTPEVSRFTRTFSRHPDLVKIEARVLIDGKLVASCSFDRASNWPQDIYHSFEFSKNGDLEMLMFPAFRDEVLQQSLWNAADDLGRIKIILSEGFPRDSISMPIERIRNIVAFSFQHAPLDILETSSIAWPNANMWRRIPAISHLPVPTYHPDDGADSHAHSPRRRPKPAQANPSTHIGACYPAQPVDCRPSFSLHPSPTTFNQPVFPSQLGISRLGQCLPNDPSTLFSDLDAYQEWLTSVSANVSDVCKHDYGSGLRYNRRLASSDTSMADFTSTDSSGKMSILMADAMVPGFMGLGDELRPAQLNAQSNATMAAINHHRFGGIGVSPLSTTSRSTSSYGELESTLSASLLNQPLPNAIHVQPKAKPSVPAAVIKSRKEHGASESVSVPLSPKPIPSPPAVLVKTGTDNATD